MLSLHLFHYHPFASHTPILLAVYFLHVHPILLSIHLPHIYFILIYILLPHFILSIHLSYVHPILPSIHLPHAHPILLFIYLAHVHSILLSIHFLHFSPILLHSPSHNTASHPPIPVSLLRCPYSNHLTSLDPLLGDLLSPHLMHESRTLELHQ